MKIKTLAFLTILMAILSSAAYRPTAAHDSSDTPYIYYYSEEQPAIIIERADGSNSRILTHFTMPQPLGGTPIISGPGWSPSGQWFAWTVTIPQGGGAAFSVGMIVSRDGMTLINLSTETEGDSRFDMEWSPTDDLLSVSELYFPPDTDGSDVTTRKYIYSPDTQQIVTEFEPTRHISEWSPDGQFMLTTLASEGVFHLTDLSGVSSTRRYLGTLDWSGEGSQAVYQTEVGTLIFEDLSTGEVNTLESPETYLLDVDWSPNDEWVLLNFRNSFEDIYGELWLYLVADNTMTLIDDSASIASTDAKSYSFFYSQSIWSEDGAYFTYETENNQQIIFDMETMSSVALPLPSSDSVHIREWTVNHRLVMFADSNETSLVLYTYDVDSGTLTEWNRINYFYRDAFLSTSPDGRYIVHTSHNEEYFYSVDTHSGDVQHIDLLPQDYFIGPSEMVWHPSENWLFLYGFGQGTRTIFISNPDGTLQRELGLCINMGSCFGWLPPLTN